VVEYQFYESAIGGYPIADYKNSLKGAFATKTKGTALTSTGKSLPLSPAKQYCHRQNLVAALKTFYPNFFDGSLAN
jgi:hypothetical protein